MNWEQIKKQAQEFMGSVELDIMLNKVNDLSLGELKTEYEEMRHWEGTDKAEWESTNNLDFKMYFDLLKDRVEQILNRKAGQFQCSKCGAEKVENKDYCPICSFPYAGYNKESNMNWERMKKESKIKMADETNLLEREQPFDEPEPENLEETSLKKKELTIEDLYQASDNYEAADIADILGDRAIDNDDNKLLQLIKKEIIRRLTV